jgi:LacI family transcriptional regulator
VALTMARTPGTLRNVAEQANVSIATVSYVLSGKGRMSINTRRRIESLLREAGLRPQYKRYPVFYLSDRGKLSDSAIIKPLLDIYEGLNRSLHAAGINIRAEFLNESNAGPLEAQLEQLAAYKPGAVVLDTNLEDQLPAIASFFEQGEIPAVQVGHIARSPTVDAVVVDNFGGAYEATRHLIEIGHRRIATIRWNTAKDPASAKKHAGFTCAVTEAGLPLRPEYEVESPYTKVGSALPGRIAAEKLLALPEPPTAVFVENSFISPSLLYPSFPGETKVPDAIAALDFVHFEAWHLEGIEQVMAGKLAFPGRKTKLMRVNWHELGNVAGRRVVDRIEGAKSSGNVVQIVPRLFEAEGERYRQL